MPKPRHRSSCVMFCNHILLVLCCIGIQHSWAASLSPSPQSPTKEVPQDLAETIDSFIESALDSCPTPGLSVSVVKDGQVILSKGYGHTSADKTKEVTSKTKFAIGSLTKAFTALLIAKMVKSENITFDTPIKQFLPDFRLVDDYRSEHASLRDLLGHRTAIPGNSVALLLGMDVMSRKELSSKIQYLKTPYSFREKAIYNNYMYILAGDILERMSQGRSWESLVRESIFKPLGMTQSGFLNHAKNFSDFALPCDLVNGSLVDIDPVVFETGEIAGPAGSIYSTADDMAKWMMFLLSKGRPITNTSRLDIDSSMVDMTFEPSIHFDVHALPNLYRPKDPVSQQQIVYCMGWITSMYREFRNIFHTGGIVTYKSRLWLCPDENLGIFVSANGPFAKQMELSTSLPYYISDLMLGLPTWFNSSDVCSSDRLPWNKKNGQVVNATTPQPDVKFNCTTDTHCNLSDYVGVYVHKVLGNASISLYNNDNGEPKALKLTYGSFGLLELSPKSRTFFAGKLYGPLWYAKDFEFMATFSFRKDSLNKGRNDVASFQLGIFDIAIGPFEKQGVPSTNTCTQG